MSGEIIPYADKIVDMIEQARQNALRSVNAELIKLYWNVGKYLSEESAKSSWGDAFIEETANYIKENCPGIKGFNRRGLYRMRQFYESYKGNEFVSPLVTQISWTNHLVIMVNFKTFKTNFKDKKRQKSPDDQLVIFKNVHEPIIDPETWETANRIRQNAKRRRPNSFGAPNPLTGLLWCADLI